MFEITPPRCDARHSKPTTRLAARAPSRYSIALGAGSLGVETRGLSRVERMIAGEDLREHRTARTRAHFPGEIAGLGEVLREGLVRGFLPDEEGVRLRIERP